MCDAIRGGQKLAIGDLYVDDRESGDNDSDDSDDSDDDGSVLWAAHAPRPCHMCASCSHHE